MKIKRIISIILAALIIFCFMVACGPDNSVGGSDDNGDSGSPVDGEDGGSASGDVDDGGENDDGENDDGDSGGVDNGGGSDSNLTGTPEEILGKLIDDLMNSGVEMPMSVPPMEVAADMSQNTVGLSEADFDRYVADSSYTMAAIGTFAHQIIVIQAVDDGAAGEVKRIVAGDNGYDAKKWICVFPEKAVAVESGCYVLLIASSAEVVDAAVEAFRAAAGSIGDVNTFWEFVG